MLSIIDFDPQYRTAFKTLNFEWIEKYFSVCDTDIEQLSNPEKIIQEGGRVFFCSI